MTCPGLRPHESSPFPILLTLSLVALIGLASSAYAQREPGSITLGAQVGRPGGLALKVYRPDAVAYEALLTVDGDDFVRLAAFRLWERPLPDSMVYVYYGPGLVAGGRRLDTDPSLTAGIGGKLGLNFYADRFEVFLHVTPIVRGRPRPEAHLGVGVGLRYDLYQP